MFHLGHFRILGFPLVVEEEREVLQYLADEPRASSGLRPEAWICLRLVCLAFRSRGVSKFSFQRKTVIPLPNVILLGLDGVRSAPISQLTRLYRYGVRKLRRWGPLSREFSR